MAGTQGKYSGLISLEMKDDIERRLANKESLRSIASSLGVCFQTLQYWRKKWGGEPLVSSCNRKGAEHHHWKGGRSISKGYVLIHTPDRLKAHPYTYEHVLVAEARIGRRLTKGEHVHHINGVKTDNRDENLHVCSEAEHKSLHHQLMSISLEFFADGQVVFEEGAYRRVR